MDVMLKWATAVEDADHDASAALLDCEYADDGGPWDPPRGDGDAPGQLRDRPW